MTEKNLFTEYEGWMMLCYVVFKRMELITKMRLKVYLIKPTEHYPPNDHRVYGGVLYDGVLNFAVSFSKIGILEVIITMTPFLG